MQYFDKCPQSRRESRGPAVNFELFLVVVTNLRELPLAKSKITECKKKKKELIKTS
jgi:hypothetical protein